MDFFGGRGSGGSYIQSIQKCTRFVGERPVEEEVGEQMIPEGTFRPKLLADTRAGEEEGGLGEEESLCSGEGQPEAVCLGRARVRQMGGQGCGWRGQGCGS